MLKKINSDQLFTASVLIVGLFALMLSSALIRFDHVFYDLGRYLTVKAIPEDIVIIAIDDRSLDALGKWPWSRETHAVMLKQLNKSKPLAIGLDVLFSEPDDAYPQDDLLLAKAIKEAGNVVLPIVIEAPYQGASLNQDDILPMLVESAAATGRVNVPLDVDGIARSVYLWEGISTNGQDVVGLPHFGQSILEVAGLLPESLATSPPDFILQPSKSQSVHAEQKRIQFYGRPNEIKQVSFVNVWSGSIPTSYFDGKIVLIGATAVGMGDQLVTPVSSYSKPMAGVEFNANVVESIRHSALISDLPRIVYFILAVFLVLIPLVWLPKTTPLVSLLLVAAYLCILLVGSILLPILSNFWFPPSAVFAMVLLAYPIWSWRRIERAYAFFNVELQNLDKDLRQFGKRSVANDRRKNLNGTLFRRRDLFQSRIAQLKYAAASLRTLQKNRDDSLAFISHDLKMPLATALMLLNESDYKSNRLKVVGLLEQGIAMADDFLNISKAETANSEHFKEMEVNGLMQEVVDDLFKIAQQQQVKLNLVVCNEALWMKADFSLMYRAFANVINNAVKFSHADGVVDINLLKQARMVVIQIKDDGIGVDQDELSAIFKKFKQIKLKELSVQGSGLGLYFVDIAVKKHQGSIDVESEVGKGTTFTFKLPLLKD